MPGFPERHKRDRFGTFEGFRGRGLDGDAHGYGDERVEVPGLALLRKLKETRVRSRGRCNCGSDDGYEGLSDNVVTGPRSTGAGKDDDVDDAAVVAADIETVGSTWR